MHVTAIDISLTNSLKPGPPMSALLEGLQTVEGRVSVDVASPALARWFEAQLNRQANEFLRMARPHMPKRMFLRLRGRVRAERRRAR